MFKIDVRVSEKAVLSIEEAAALYNIGEGKIRDMIAENPGADWILKIGNRSRIKRKQFDKLIDNADYL